MKMHKLSLHHRLALLCAWVASVGTAAAQNFNIDWFTIDGGGGTSTGGVYAVSGTIGQPDAGVASGGGYSLAGGFWSGVVAIATPGAPLLTIEPQPDGSVRVAWPAPATGFVIEEASALATLPAVTAWTPVNAPYQTNSAVISITAPATAGTRFYRLRHP